MAKVRKDGSGSFFRDARGQWIAQIRVFDDMTGKSRQVRRRAKSRDHARQLLAELRANPPVARANGLLLADVLERWCAETLPHSGLAPNTRDIYRQCLSDYGIPAAGAMRLDKFTPSLADKWLVEVRATRKLGRRNETTGVRIRDGEPIAPSTVRNTYIAAVKALDWAVRDGLTASNPLRSVARPVVPRVGVPVTKAEEVDRLLVACQGRRIESLVWFVANTGVRVGEALSLRWSDVDLGSSTATIRRGTLGGTTTKTGRIRTVTLVPDLVARLRSHRIQQNAERLALGSGWGNHDGLVFTSVSGQPLDRSNVTHELQRALRVADVTTARPWHALRHGLAHRLIVAGVPLATVSAILGHSGIGITADTYGHVDAAVPVDVLEQALAQRAEARSSGD